MTAWQECSRKKIIHPNELEGAVQKLRARGKKIATLNGSFDLLHAGHLFILFEASKVGDILIVGLNTDESVKAYKGANRPYIPLNYRIEMITALSFVNFVTWFNEPDPRALLEKVRPDVHVNGAEYGENCIEAEVVKKHGGRLHLVERLPGLSSSEIIAKIRCA